MILYRKFTEEIVKMSGYQLPVKALLGYMSEWIQAKILPIPGLQKNIEIIILSL